MANNLRQDPLTTFCFRVMIQIPGNEGAEAYFKAVSGLKYDSEVVDFKEGGRNVTTRRLFGSTKWPNIVLQKGFTGPPMTQLLQWRRDWLNDDPKTPLKRANGEIVQLNHKMKKMCSWKWVAGWPCKWEGPDYDASKSELAIEKLEIAHEGLTFDPSQET